MNNTSIVKLRSELTNMILEYLSLHDVYQLASTAHALETKIITLIKIKYKPLMAKLHQIMTFPILFSLYEASDPKTQIVIREYIVSQFYYQKTILKEKYIHSNTGNVFISEVLKKGIQIAIKRNIYKQKNEAHDYLTHFIKKQFNSHISNVIICSNLIRFLTHNSINIRFFNYLTLNSAWKESEKYFLFAADYLNVPSHKIIYSNDFKKINERIIPCHMFTYREQIQKYRINDNTPTEIGKRYK